jgi:transcription elongation GreA/GreB family factor
MNKKNLIEHICQLLEKDLQIQKAAALATYEAATGEESKAENQYDTRGLEASYLAGAQAKRVGEIEEQLTIYKYLEIKDFNGQTPVAATALVELLDANDKKSKIFILPKGGGLSVQWQSQTLQVITPNSPLGEAVVGLKVGDGFLVEIGARSKEYEIISVE